MSKSRISLVALALALGVSAPAFAQDAATTEAPAEAPAAAPAEAAAPAAPKEGDLYIKESFESWQVQCTKTDLAADPCQLTQILKDQAGTDVAQLALFNLPSSVKGDAVAGAKFFAPLGTDLSVGVALAVDTSAPRAYPFAACDQGGCMSNMGFTKAEVDAFKKGAKANFTVAVYSEAGPRPVPLEVSLKGFTAGYDAVVVANDAFEKVAAEAAKAAAAAAPAPAQ